MTIEQMTELLLKFRRDRDWEQFHTAKDQMLSLTLEAAEVLELAQWREGDALDEHLQQNKEALGDELADVLNWVLLIAHDQKIDLADALVKKIAKNAIKYPVDQAKGRADKYTAYKEKEK